VQEAKLETPSGQQLCTMGNPSTSGESQHLANETNVVQSDHHVNLNDEAADNQKVSFITSAEEVMFCVMVCLFVCKMCQKL